MAHKRTKQQKSWISRTKYEIENEEELLSIRLAILRVVRFMKDYQISEKDMAEKMGVTPQFLGRLLNGQELGEVASMSEYSESAFGVKLKMIQR